MKRSRSALARHRKQKLLEATQHVSTAPELRLVGELAAATEPASLLDDVVSDWDHHHTSRLGDTVVSVVQVLRNVNNSVYHRAMAARALGLLMRRDPSLMARLRLESEDLLDALLQLINCCRRFQTHNNDTRRVHVNCCLVISMLTRAPGAPAQPLVVSLESELLAMPARPTDPSSSFLLLTVSGRPESSSSTDVSFTVGGMGVQSAMQTKDRAPLRPLSSVPSPPQRHSGKPGPSIIAKSKERAGAKDKLHHLVADADEEQRLAHVIHRRQTPSREFKMDRFRVVTPVMVPSSVQGPRWTPKTPLLVIPPSHSSPSPPGSNQNSSPRAGDAVTGPPPASASLVPSQHMVEILRTGKMPIAAVDYHRDRLRDDIGTAGSTPTNRLAVVEWGEWRRRSLGESHDGNDDIETPILPLSPPTTHGHHPQPVPTPDIHTPEYKRERLREILSSPADASIESMTHLQELDARDSSTTLAALTAERAELHAAEQRSRLAMRTHIEAQRDQLPLKFLFTLPGGAAYCRHRMRRALELWVHEFKTNQQRLALLQWKTVVEQLRYKERGHVYQRLALEKRLRAAIEFVLRGYQRQAIAAWVAATQTAIWHARDAATRQIQRQVRRHRALLTFLQRHHAHPFGGPYLRDVWLAPPRHGLPFAIPPIVRDQRRRLWFAAETLQRAIRYRRFRRFLLRYRIAATKIQARARMRIAQHHFREQRRRIILLQAWVRGHRDYVAYHALRAAAVLVQTAFRGVRMRRQRRLVLQAQRREAERRLSAVLLIQRMARGLFAKREAQRRRDECAARWHAALVVQRAWYRRNNEWSTFLLLGCLREQETEELQLAKRLGVITRRSRARQIQRVWASYRFQKRTQAALFVQRNVRRWLATRRVCRLRLETMARRRIKWFLRFRHAYRVNTATRLQFWWLCAVPGRLARHLRMRRLIAEAQARARAFFCRYDAAVVIQRMARGRRGRVVAKCERCARVIQRAIREFLFWRRVQRELRQIKHIVAVSRAQEYISTGSQRVLEAKMSGLHAAATRIHRRMRGVLTRMQLTRSLVMSERRDAMARRLQQRWRQSAQHRVAQRVLVAQRRRRENPFAECGSISDVITATIQRATALYDPQDELQGIHVAAWLRRLGMNEEKYAGLFKGPSDVAKLRQLSMDACREKLETMGVDDDEHVRQLATHLLARRTIEEAKKRRRDLGTLRNLQQRDTQREATAALVLRRTKQQVEKVQEQLEQVLQDASEFRNPPKALRDERERVAQRLAEAEREVVKAQRQHQAIVKRLEQHQRTIALRQVELVDVEKDEVSASYSVANFRLLTGRPHVAREIFLAKFPGLEARALAFAGAVGESVSTWQLIRFFQANTTVAAVKHAMPTLIYCAVESEVTRHDHARLNQCCDVLQYGCEHIGDVLGLSVESMALGLEERPREGEWLTSTVIDAMATLRTGRAVKDRVDGWMAWVSTLEEMNAVAVRVQSHWRRRAATHMTAAMKAAQWQQRMKDAYVAEVNADYVMPLWCKEREREQRELEEWEKEEALRLREEALQQILRYPWRDVWDEDAQRYGVCREDPVLGWEWLLDDEPRPVYSVDEEDAAIVIQSISRRWLARQELRGRQRLHRRQIRRETLERQWQRVAHEREQSVTLRLSLRVSADADVSVWFGRRGRPPPKETSPKRQRQVVDQQEEEKKRVAVVASVDRIDARLATVVPQCVETYNVSVRAAHRRNMTFPTAARPPNAHARAILAQVDATQRLHRTLAPQVTTGTSLPFTRAALPFGWRQEGDYYYHVRSGESSWDRPLYTFIHEHAAIMMQSVARMMLAQAARQRMIESMSVVKTSRDAVAAAARIGWIGVGLEGITPRVLLSRLGIARQTIDATPYSVEVLLRPPSEAKLLQLGWTKEEVSVLVASASVLRPLRRKRPLTSYALPLNPVTKHPFNVLPSERAVQQIVAQSLPNQQGRVATLVNAVLQSNTPVAYRQLEMHLRRFAGRPDDAAARIHEIASLPFATQPPQEQVILSELSRGLERCLVTASVLRLTALHSELSTVARVAAALLDDHQDNQSKDDDSLLYSTHVLRSPATPLAKRPQTSTLTASISLARAWCLASSPKGLWEPRPETPDVPLSFAQVARFVRLRGLERALEWWRCATLVQSVLRMHRTRVWYTLTVAWRNASCTKLQSAWRGFVARELRRLLEAQRRSVYETRRDALTQKFYIVHVPTGEKLLDEPRDAFGVLLPVRSMVQDRVTKRWMRAWPLDTNQPSRDQRPKDDSDSWTVPCSMCKVERGVRRCLECMAPTGDYVDYCLTCFFDAHDDSSTHTFSLLHAATRVAFHCVECQRFSSRRCLACDEHYCARCFARVHRRGHRRVGHQCEHYATRAKVCAECEQRVAMLHCQVCGDSLCESCATVTHARGAKRSHTLVLLPQPLEDGEVYCEQCKARRGERGACAFCQATLCAVCLVDEGKHAVECVETRLALAVRALVGDCRCVECGKRADRKCQTCGDLYCSVRWMGNAGCFERFHWKGRRADHAYAPLPLEEEEQESEKRRKMEEEIKALEEQVRVKRREDAVRAEQEASELAAALRRAAEHEAASQAEMAKQTKAASKKRRNKVQRSSQQKPGACHVDGCTTMTLSAAVPFCAKHLTSQHALEIAQQDPLEAAKLLATVEQNGGKLPVPTSIWSRLWQRFPSPKKPAPSTGGNQVSAKDGTKKTKAKNKP